MPLLRLELQYRSMECNPQWARPPFRLRRRRDRGSKASRRDAGCKMGGKLGSCRDADCGPGVGICGIPCEP
eukprot:7643438-Pyramimonas_sp.AAC.1